MGKKLQLKVIVFLCMVIVIFVYFYISRSFSFNIVGDLNNFKDSVNFDISSLSSSEFTQDVQERFFFIKDKIKEEDEVLKIEISEKVIEKLGYKENVIYEYEPWGIKFSYDSLMLKEINQGDKEILLSYDDVQNVYLTISKKNIEEDFNNWLNNNYDLQSLDKYEHNGLIFWVQDFSDDESRVEEYYFNRGEDVFIFSLNSSKENEDVYWSILESIIKSFDLIEDINL